MFAKITILSYIPKDKEEEFEQATTYEERFEIAYKYEEWAYLEELSLKQWEEEGMYCPEELKEDDE